ncbi:MAG: hypothetical protein ACOC9T_03575 [Myxococcota bacterium]
MSDHLYCLVKLVEEPAHADELRKGTLFMRSLKYHQQCEDQDESGRRDRMEGAMALRQPDGLSGLSIGPVHVPASDLVGPVIFKPSWVMDARVFCMLALSSRDLPQERPAASGDLTNHFLLDPQCAGLGDTAVIITDVQEFIRRVVEGIRRSGCGGSLGLVDYIDDAAADGPLDTRPGYAKPRRFAYQREYRVMIHTDPSAPDPYRLNIGDLSDITAVTSAKTFNRHLKVCLPEDAHT